MSKSTKDSKPQLILLAMIPTTEVEFTTASVELREVVLLVVLRVVDGAREISVHASSVH